MTLPRFNARGLHVWLALLLIAAASCTKAGRDTVTVRGAGATCSEAWYQFVEEKVSTGDIQGHGPDIGSDEWKSVIEFKLGIRGNPDIPQRDSDDWCRYTDRLLRAP